MMTNILQKYLLEILQCKVQCSKGSVNVLNLEHFFQKVAIWKKKILIHNNYTNYASLDTRKQLFWISCIIKKKWLIHRGPNQFERPKIDLWYILTVFEFFYVCVAGGWLANILKFKSVWVFFKQINLRTCTSPLSNDSP